MGVAEHDQGGAAKWLCCVAEYRAKHSLDICSMARHFGLYTYIYIYVCSILVDMALYVYSLVWTQSPSRAPNILQSQLVTSGRSRNSKYVNRKTRVQVMLVSGSSEE